MKFELDSPVRAFRWVVAEPGFEPGTEPVERGARGRLSSEPSSLRFGFAYSSLLSTAHVFSPLHHTWRLKKPWPSASLSVSPFRHPLWKKKPELSPPGLALNSLSYRSGGPAALSETTADKANSRKHPQQSQGALRTHRNSYLIRPQIGAVPYRTRTSGNWLINRWYSS